MVDSYRFGKIVINGKTYRMDCIVTHNTVITEWWRKKGHELSVEDIREVIEKERPEFVVVGKGKYGLMKILKETDDFLNELGIKMRSGKTDEAARVYNEICTKKRTVGFFHLTC